MLQLIYISTVRAKSIDDALLQSILTASRRNNAAAGVSGLLVAGGRRFLQALEGPRDAVEATYVRIKADPRHFACVELSRSTIASPQFGTWSMAYSAGDGAGEGTTLSQTVDALTRHLDDPNVRATFTGFAEIHSRAA